MISVETHSGEVHALTARQMKGDLGGYITLGFEDLTVTGYTKGPVIELVQKLRKLCEAAEQELQDSSRTEVSAG